MVTEPLETGSESRSTTRQRSHDAMMGHGWMMLGCATMLIVAVALVGTGTASVGVILPAVGCIVMMGLMMGLMMGGASRVRGHGRHQGPS